MLKKFYKGFFFEYYPELISAPLKHDVIKIFSKINFNWALMNTFV